MDKLFSSNPLLRRIGNTAWAAATFNLGPRTVTVPHTDLANLAWGWCAITALGNYDYRHGGHLILWDIGLIIEFPPGTTMLIPSAVIRHSNTTIAHGEERYSFTQYSAGGLFRWVSNGGCSDKSFELNATEAQRIQRVAERTNRWEKGLGMLSKFSDIINTVPSS